MTERRQFSRIAYGAAAVVQHTDLKISGQVVDLSLHGLLISSVESNKLSINQDISVSFTLPESDIEIVLDGSIVAIQNNALHIRITLIDVDGMSHLKRLIELNTSNDYLLYRELEKLIELNQA